AYRRQDNLASDIDELIDRVHPVNAAKRWKNEVVGAGKGFSGAGDEKTPATLPAADAGGATDVVLIRVGLAPAVALSGGDGEAAKELSKDAKKGTADKAEAAKRTARAKAAQGARAAKA